MPNHTACNTKQIYTNLGKIMIICLASLIVVLPIAHTNALRSLFLMGLLISWLYKMYLDKKIAITRTSLELPLLLFFLTIVISLFTSLKLSTSLNELRGEFFIPVALFYMTATNFKDENKSKTLYWLLCLASLSMSLIGIGDFFLRGGSLTNYDIRAHSLHQGFGAFSQYLIIVIPYAAMGLLHSDNFRHKVFLAGTLLIQLFTLYITYTRGAWVGLAIATFMSIFLIANTLAKKRTLIAGYIVLLLITGTLLPKQVIWHGKSEGVSLEEKHLETKNTATNRLIMWKAAAEELLKNPFKGAGFGKANFGRRFAGKNFSSYEQAHNTFVNIAIQLGIQGLLALLFIIYRLLKVTWNGYKQASTSWEKIFLGGTWLMIWGSFAGNQFAEFYIDDTSLLFWMLCGLSLALCTKERTT